MNCRHCGKPIGYVTDDPNYQAIGGYVHHPEDGPDSYLDCGDEFGTQAEPETEEDRRVPYMFHAFEYVDALANVAARNYALTDDKNSQVEFRTYWDAGHILLMRHNDMIIEGYYRTHPLPATEQAVQSCQ